MAASSIEALVQPGPGAHRQSWARIVVGNLVTVATTVTVVMSVGGSDASHAMEVPAASVAAQVGGEAGGCPDGMTYLPAAQLDARPDAWAKPRQVAALCIDAQEVTVAQYAACVDRDECEAAQEVSAAPDPGCTASWADAGERPMNCVTWLQASQYCASRGMLLPSEAQWERAAGRVPDLGGDVREWTADGLVRDPEALARSPWGPYDVDRRMVRGVGFADPELAEVSPVHREPVAVGERRSDLGFRCVVLPES